MARARHIDSTRGRDVRLPDLSAARHVPSARTPKKDIPPVKKSAIAAIFSLGLLVAIAVYEGNAAAGDPLTLAEYQKIKAGSNEKILFRYASTCQQEDEAGPSEGYPVTWTCYGADGTSSAVFFYSGGVLFSKAQSGLT